MSTLIPKYWLDLSFSEPGLTSSDVKYTDTTTIKSAIDDLYNKMSYYTLTIIKTGYGSGTVTSSPSGINCGSACSYQFSAGTNVTLTATPDPSFVFSGWSGGATGTNPIVTITMNHDTIVEATFEMLYNLVIIKSGTGTGTVTSSPSGINCGSICSYQFASDTSITLTATPNSPSVFSGWSGDVVSSNSTVTVTMNSNKSVTAIFNILYTLTVTKSGAGTGTVTSSPAGINCGATCSYQFISGTSVILTAAADATSIFSGWSGDATGTNTATTVTMSSNKNVTATFNIAYILTITKSGTGTGTVTSSPSGINCGATCSYQFASGTSITLTATPDSSSVFSGWSGDATGTSSTVTVTMSANKNVTATFTPKYTLTVTKSGTGTGTVTSNPAGINCGATCSYQFVSGTSVTLTATPDSLSVFGGWSGDATGTSSTVTITMSANKNVTATFNALYTLTLTKTGTGTGTVTSNPAGINCGATCSYQFVSSTSITLTATPDSSSVFSGWSGDTSGSSSTVTIIMNSNKNVTATFNALYTLTVTKSGNGGGAVTSSPSGINCGAICSYQFVSGTNVTLTATPDASSVFSGWSGDATGSSSTVMITMNSNKSMTATFNALYTLTVTKSGTGTGAVTSSPSGINCGATCSYQFVSNTNVTLTATPDSSSIFSGWSGDVTGSSSTVMITMNSNKNMTATFTPKCTLTITKSGNGGGAVTSSPSGINCGATCSYQFVPDTNVTLTATPDSSSVFSGWSGDATGSSSTVMITMNANKNMTATFNALYTLTLTKTGTGTGTVTSNPSGINCGTTCSYQFVSGTNVILTATPDSLSVFSGWSGDAAGSSSPVTITMNSNKNVTATFNALYTLTVTKSGDGGGTVSSSPSGINCGGTCSYQFVSGTNVILTATPDSLSVVSGWSGDATGTNSTVTITMNSNKSVTAIFNINAAGFFAGGIHLDSSNNNVVYQSFIDKLLFSNDSQSTLSATLSQSTYDQSACNSSLLGYFSGGQCVWLLSFIDKLLFSNETRSTLSATLSQSVKYQSACNSSLAGYFAGGNESADGYNDPKISFIDKLLFSNETRSTLGATLSQAIYWQAACNSLLVGYFAGGFNGSDTVQSFIDKLLFSNDSRSTLSTTILSPSMEAHSACNSSLAGYFAGGYNPFGQSYIEKLLFSNETRSTLSATLSHPAENQSACNSILAGYFAGGYTGDYQSSIDKLLFSDDSRSMLSAKLSQTIGYQSACQSGGIV
jgi:uncharacterized repeat protein (TIGR02543 family)